MMDKFKILEHYPILERIYGIGPEKVLVNSEYKGYFLNPQSWDSNFILVDRKEFERIRDVQHDSILEFF